MSYEGLLTHRATIERRVDRKDRFNQPLDLWEEKVADAPCRLSAPRGGEVYTDRSRDVVRADYVVYFPVGTDIGETDRITHVKDARGSVVVDELDILLVRPVTGLDGLVHHVECPCSVTRQAG